MEKLRDIAPEAITIALLAGLESLLSAVVADGMTGYRHKSNCELVAQGLGNIGSILFGGIPATGAIARTATNIRLGAKTPISGMFHAIFVFLILFLFSKFASKIPLACLASILMVIAWHMADLKQVVEIFKGPKSDIALLLITFAVAVIIDITVAVEIGVLLAAIFFMKRMADSTSISKRGYIEGSSDIVEKKDPDALYRKEIPKGIEVFQINGPLFFGAADLLSNGVSFSKNGYKIVILRMSHVQVIDMTGVKALKFFYDRCNEEGLTLLVSGINSKVLETLNKTGISKEIGHDHIFPHIDDALAYAKLELVKT
jgi:SulP family sulfate permease